MKLDIRGKWEYRRDTSCYRLWNLPFMPTVSYPLRAAKISIDLNFLGCWWKPSFTYRDTMSEHAKAEGEPIWWARWLFFQISYSRFL